MNNKHFFITLAASNINKNGKFYFPYLLTFIATVAMFYIMSAICYNEGIASLPGADSMQIILKMGSQIIGIFAIIFLFYTNSFLIKRRKKEFGLYNILGMEKRHVAKVLFLESILIAVAGIAGGLIVGILFNKLLVMILLKLLQVEIAIKFSIEAKAIIKTIELFSVIFLMTFAANEIQMVKTKTVELLYGEKIGEKEPKTKWLMAILGVAAIAVGYYLALTTKNPLSALNLFFVAVILVIFGTYFLFVAGSIALLKLLRKNKKYYYKTKHFTAVSGMIYRMKQNAVGLASICILSTMVLVMLSTTVSLYMGMEDLINNRFTSDFSVVVESVSDDFNREEIEQKICKKIEKSCTVKDLKGYYYLTFAALKDGDTYHCDYNNDNTNIVNLQEMVIFTAEDYSKLSGENVELEEKEVLVYDSEDKTSKSFTLLGDNYTVKNYLDSFDIIDGEDIVTCHYIVVKDLEVMKNIHEQVIKQNENLKVNQVEYEVDIDVKATTAEQIKAEEALQKMKGCVVEGRASNRKGFYTIYGGLLFLGLFLGIVFIMATALIIYYKQISEGYDDKERFKIMQKVGMSKKEVKSSIRSQVLMVFFLPLIMAVLHVVVAFPMITKLMKILYLTNTNLFIVCLIGTVIAFTVMYTLVYSMTSKVYYKIVE